MRTLAAASIQVVRRAAAHAALVLAFVGSANCRLGYDAAARPARAVSTTRLAGADEPLVELVEVDPRIRLDLRYATPHNFLGRAVYPEARCFVRRSVARRLRGVQDELANFGLGLVVFDGYRPLRVQREMWRLVPDPDYVADPAVGSRHNRGAAVDVSLVNRDGVPLPMPTEFDDFSPAARRDAPTPNPAAKANRDLLTRVMEAHGFIGMASEWWHFDAADWRDFPVVTDDDESSLTPRRRKD